MTTASPRGALAEACALFLLIVLPVVWWTACSPPTGSGGDSAGSDETQVTPPVPAGSEDIFEDVTSGTGLGSFRHRLADGELSNIVESLGAGAVWLDHDGDGRVDLYLLQGAALTGVSAAGTDGGGLRNRLFRNLGAGGFADVTDRAGVGDGGFGTAGAAADYDNDGDTDLYVVNVGANVLYRNRGDGTFEDATREAGVGDRGTGVGAVFFDADRDGFNDLFVVNYLSFDPSYRHHYGPDAFPGPLAYPAEMNVLYRNRGDGTFEDVSEAAGIRLPGHRGMAVVAWDWDHDGDQDLYVTNDASPNLLLQNDGQGRFRDVALPAGVAYSESGEATASMAADVGECNGDGRPDLLVTDTAFGSLYLADESGIFRDSVLSSGVGLLMAQYVSWGGNLLDFDNDGDLDIFVANGDLHYLTGWEDLLLENRGDGSYADASRRGGAWFAARLCGRGSSVADFDNDGRLDLLITHLGDRPALLRNRSQTANHWIEIRLVGTRSNRDGFGAWVTVTVAGQDRVQEARCRSGYLSQGDGRLHFGLGRHEVVDRITVDWPSGGRDSLEGVPADRIVQLRESEGSR